MAGKTNIVSWDLITSFVIDAFVGYGVPEEDAKICADILLESDKRGIESHGVNRLKPIYLDRIKAGIINPVTDFEIIRETPTTAVVDGNNGMGQVVGCKSMQMAIEKAKKYGMGMVAARNSNHYGIAGYYATMATDAGCIGITGTNARPSIAPTFGVQNMLGTNPLTFGMPTDEDFPFVLDCATSITQRGKIEYYARLGMPTPAGMVIGRDGEPKTDSEQIFVDLNTGDAALAPLGGIGEELGGYKGYGYATVVEILSAALQQGNFLTMLSGIGQNGEEIPYRLGHFFIAIDTEAFMGLDEFKKTCGDILRELRASAKAPGHDRIYTDSLYRGLNAAIQFMPSVLSVLYFVFIVLYYIEVQKQSRAQRERDMLAAQIRGAHTELANLRQMQENAAAYRHDMRHHIAILSGMAAEGSLEKIRTYLNTAQSDIEAITPTRYCKNETVNLILSTFSSKARHEEVTMTVDAKLPEYIPFSDTELCSLLSNGIENAIFAAASCPEPELRTVSVKAKILKSTLLISIVNPYVYDVVMKDGLPQSARDGHGFGTRSIAAIAAAHNGQAVFAADDGVFTFKIMIPLVE